jgi:predicted Fe-S protein YdhL (DUF1289 family)
VLFARDIPVCAKDPQKWSTSEMSRRPKPSKTQCELHLVFPFPSSLNLLPCSLCCECGSPIEPNPSNMCVACLRTKVDITEGIPKQVTLQFCRGCERYHNPPSEWVHCVLESKELLSLCLKKLKGLSRVKLVDAGFVWTEPHSKRIKVKLTVHGEVLGGAMLEQVFVVDYIVNHQMCDDCHRSEAQNFWSLLGTADFEAQGAREYVGDQAWDQACSR